MLLDPVEMKACKVLEEREVRQDNMVKMEVKETG